MSRYQRMRQIYRDAELALKELTDSPNPGPDQIEWAKEYLRYIMENSRPYRRTTDKKSV